MITDKNYNNEIEEIIIGGIISAYAKNIVSFKELKKEFFYFDKNKIIFEACLDLIKNFGEVDLPSLRNKLKKENKLEMIGGTFHLTSCINIFDEHQFSLKNKIKILEEIYYVRKFKETLEHNLYKVNEGKYKDVNELLSDFNKDFFNLSSRSIKEKVDIKSIIKSFTKRQNEYTTKKICGDSYLGIPTGFYSLDKISEGYNPEHLVSFSAYTNVGKTTLMINLIKNLLDQDKRVCVFSLEMSQEDLFGKLLAIDTGIPKKKLMKDLDDNEIYAKQEEAKKRLSEKKCFMYSQLNKLEDIVMAMQTEKLKNKIDVFFLDYIQNISSTNISNEYLLLTNAVKTLQQVNRNLKSTLVLLSQISNETNRKEGTLNVEGKGTGAIKAASDLFVFMKRDGEEEEINDLIKNKLDIPIKMIINKNRHDYLGSFILNHKLNTGEMYEPI